MDGPRSKTWVRELLQPVLGRCLLEQQLDCDVLAGLWGRMQRWDPGLWAKAPQCSGKWKRRGWS